MPSRRALLGTVAAGAVGVAGCNVLGDDRPDRRVAADWTPAPGEWAGVGYGPGRQSYNPYASPPSSEPSIEWEVEEPTPGAGSGLVVTEGTVYRRDPAALVGYDASHGAEAVRADALSGSDTWYVDGRIYVLGMGRLAAHAPDGEQLWETGTEDGGNFLVERDGYVYLGAYYRGIEWFDADSGESVGHRDVPVVGMANAGGRLYVADERGIAAYDTTGGGDLEELWRTEEAITHAWHDLSGDGVHQVASPHLAVADGTVYVVERPPDRAANESRLVLVDAAEGDVVDERVFDRAVGGPTVGDRLYLATWRVAGEGEPTSFEDGEFLALDGTDERWSREGQPFGGVIGGGSTVLVGSGDLEAPSTTAFDADDGAVRWEFDDATPIATVGKTVYAIRSGSESQRLLALRD